MIGLLLVVATAVALVGVARNVSAQTPRPGSVSVLPVSPAAEVPICPGPETLQVPQGAAPVAAPGPVTLAGVTALPSALAETSIAQTPYASRRPAAARLGGAGLNPVSAGSPASGTLVPGTPAPRTSIVGGDSRKPGGAASGPALRVSRATATQAGAWRLDSDHDGEIPVVAAAQWTVAGSGDLRGLATVDCAPASQDSWLVGGSTQPGSRLRLLLANPGASPAVVDVTVHGPQGVVQAPAGIGIGVAPGTQKALYLDALAPGLTAIAVHVEVRSGRVASVLHASVLRGLVPGGTDDVSVAAPPTRRQVIPGVSIVAPTSVPGGSPGQLPASAGDPGAVAVRVLNPGGAPAVVRMYLIGPEGEVNVPGGGVATVPARGVADLPVRGVPDGDYAAVVNADTPVVASAVVGRSRAGAEVAGTPEAARGGVPPAELAWSVGGRALQATTVVAWPPASTPGASEVPGRPPSPVVSVRLALAAAEDAGRVVLATVGADGSVAGPRVVKVEAGRTAEVEVAAGSTGLLLLPDPEGGPVTAALVLTATDAAGELISVQAIRPGARNSGSVPTVVQDPGIGLVPVQSSSR